MRRLFADTLMLSGLIGAFATVPLIVFGIAFVVAGWPQAGFPLPYPLFNVFLIMLCCASIMCISANIPPTTRIDALAQKHSTPRILIRLAGVMGLLFSIWIIVVAFIWNRFGTLAANPINTLYPTILMIFSLYLTASTDRRTLPTHVRPPFLFVRRLGTHASWTIWTLSLLLFPASLGLVMIGFADARWLLLGIVAAGLGPLFVVIGQIGTSPRRRVILFLRRFGNEDINNAVRGALRQNLGSLYRLITLDDLNFRPAGSPWEQKVIVASAAIAAALLTFSAGQIIEWIVAGVQKGESVQTDVAVPGSIDGMEGWYFEIFFAYVKIGTQLVLWYIGAIIFLSAIAILWLGKNSRLRVLREQHLKVMERQARLLKSRWRSPSLFAPESSVFRIKEPLWRPAVTLLIAHCDLYLIDVSIPSASILWELESTNRQPTRSVVLLAQNDLFKNWQAKAYSRDSLEMATNSAIAGLSLILYSSGASLDIDALAAALAKRAEPPENSKPDLGTA